ncbi:hypothetical protein JTE90_010544 [Oedothorax gibbosus]|uniref:Uncharacterized protein n=1 Tax=Oedothorax gibbosus TaxID=931172 RepID=A0AAV6TMY5_9ARAC|nr:hypothetical protein JTE90_010544 [Oedothorax gibbosus]
MKGEILYDVSVRRMIVRCIYLLNTILFFYLLKSVCGHLFSFLFEKGGNNMSRLCWVFVLVAVVVVVPCYARPHKCEQRERSLADLDLAGDSLNRAKQLYPNCEEETESSCECSKKDKSLGFIDVALDLVSNAKKNIQLCPHVPTEEPLTSTEKLLTSTEELLISKEQPLTTTEEPLTTTEEPLTTTEEP